jgi:SAM-dependent methyltransferase
MGGLPSAQMSALANALRRTADVLSDVGESRRIDWLTYNPLRIVQFHSAARRNAPAVVTGFQTVFPGARRYVDVGCGSGAYVAEGARRGLEVVGCEKSTVGRMIARAQRADARPFDLTRSPPARITGPFDVAYSIEVAEHLPPALGDALVHTVCSLADTVAFAAATPGQGGTGHVNEQPPAYWERRFGERGYEPLDDVTERLHEVLCTAGVDFWLFNLRVFARAGPGGLSASR